MSTRCKACNGSMQYSPFYIKYDDGTKVENDVCSRCTHLSQQQDYSEDIFRGLQSDQDVIKAAVRFGLKTDSLYFYED